MIIKKPIETILEQPLLQKNINKAITLLVNSFKKKNKLLICGNGGSAADALHIVGELRKNFIISRPLNKQFIYKLRRMFPSDVDYIQANLQNALPVISLVNEISLMTAINNDISSDLIFAQQLIGLGNKNDILLAISTSGNSPNIIYAVKVAKCLNMKTIALTGQKENKLNNLVDISIQAPSIITHEIQELHVVIYHYICHEIEKQFFLIKN